MQTISSQRGLRTTLALSALAASVVAMGDAGTVVVSTSLPYTDTNWSSALQLPKFDSSLGTLDSVELSFHGAVNSTMRFENKNSTARAYSANVGYSIVLSKPAGGSLLTVNPTSTTVSGNLAAFDGTVDFAGPSGVNYPLVTADATGTATLSGPTDLAAFIGVGEVSFPVDASAASRVTASGNFERVVLTQAAADITVTYHYTFERVSVGDYVWADKNKNGQQDADEPAVSGVGVSLLDGAGNVVSTTTTDSNGKYLFANLLPGEYQVKFDLPMGTAFTGADSGDDNLDSDAGAGGLSPKFTLHSGDARRDIDAGLVGIQSLGDRVWFDANSNGKQDSGELGVANVAVTLLDGAGNPIATTSTDASGIYGFSGLMPGQYKVHFDKPAGYGLTSVSAPGDITIDSDAQADGTTATVTLNPGQNRTDIDAGLVGLQSLGDRVWFDTNANGKQDVGELGIANVGVTLLDGSGNVIATTSTDANGIYGFPGLLPGQYKVHFDAPIGYSLSPLSVGGDITIDSDAKTDGTTATITLNVGDNRTDIDAGMYGLVSLGDRVWFDANANGKQDDGEKGLANLAVTLLDGSGTAIKTIQTDANGNYLFDGLMPGTYRVQFSKPAGYSYTGADAGGDDNLDSDADAGGLSPVLSVTSDRLDVDAGLVGSICLGDRVWRDDNKDGLQQTCEPGVANVVVKLLDLDGNIIAQTTTDANGYYRFVNLAPGEYVVDFDAPSGYGFTKQFANASYKQYDSNVDPINGKASVTLVNNDSTIDAGLVGALKIGDTVWRDSDGDGKYEPEVGELGIPNVKVFLVGDTNNDGWPDVIATTTTDADGHYLFQSLKPGKYAVTVNAFDIPNGLTPSFDLDGIGTRHIAIGNLTTAGDRLDFDFGYKPSTGCNTGGSHCWWYCNPTRWSCGQIWIGGKCHTKTTVCKWLKLTNCSDKSICLYQRLCAAKLNVGDGCNESVRYTCGRTTCSVKDAIKLADAWLSRNPVGCNVSGSSSNWNSICDVYGILDKFCSAR